MNDCVQFYSRILTEPTVFKAEFSIWKSKWLKEESRPNTAIEGLDNCNILLFPNIWKLLQVLATIPMSTATPERTFSSLKRLKTYLRNSTGETRLNGLALMSIHREINVDPEEVLNRFAKQSRRMMIL
ncbi:52 kDa repressor of the inhibitor of the protein kinase-like [Myzus persicae]|nr:52 kDa repressor of the inhibitor of the protein kinase-like [Myzus persicae]